MPTINHKIEASIFSFKVKSTFYIMLSLALVLIAPKVMTLLSTPSLLVNDIVIILVFFGVSGLLAFCMWRSGNAFSGYSDYVNSLTTEIPDFIEKHNEVKRDFIKQNKHIIMLYELMKILIIGFMFFVISGLTGLQYQISNPTEILPVSSGEFMFLILGGLVFLAFALGLFISINTIKSVRKAHKAAKNKIDEESNKITVNVID